MALIDSNGNYDPSPPMVHPDQPNPPIGSTGTGSTGGADTSTFLIQLHGDPVNPPDDPTKPAKGYNIDTESEFEWVVESQTWV